MSRTAESFSKPKHNKIMNILAEATGGKSYKAHKYPIDYADRPSIDYGDSEIIWKRRAETTQHRTYINLLGLSKKLASRDDQILSYFLDGSRRVFKVDDIAYVQSGGRSIIYPVIAGQIGVGCCHRVNKKVVPVQLKREFVLSMPDVADADGKPGFWPATAKKLSECDELKRLGIEFAAILPYKTSKNDDKKFEDRATACVQDRMIESEKKLVADLVREGKLNQNNYLVKDGSLEYRPTKEDKADKRRYQTFKNNYNWVIGVSKNFNPEVCEDINGKPNPGFIADLPLYHRTPVVEYENPMLGDIKFAVWYIRLRDKEKTRTPFDGVLKVEKILVTEEETEVGIDSEQVDTLSAYLINERNPVCYGSDLRWANHIYPIYLTESFVKSRYLSAESFLHLF
ncbi:hypothetical protein HM1_1332 [Heliomicrobium modesticaldum Ice1]|uniref:NurA domain-containing protein n=1 Tax=Heliobacterium modesticaldum (strain ATCC 51547 / Ice1) TaxID=498761 RepID=B0TGI5_HELMI|nr:hypothetical protein [Heliomicrobium modesticaldum]ABZ83246.1 hypothetical protein HM1_1332 [Heliomicrobium modesticaldum Ice1]